MATTASFLRYFRAQVIVRVVAICLTIAAGSYLLITSWQNLTALLILGLIVIQVVALIRHLERGTRDLLSFLEAIEYSDFTQSFSSPYKDVGFKNLYGAFARVMQAFKDTRAKNEVQRMYFETLVHHIGIGLLCYQPDGTIQLINNAAKKLLDRPALNKLQDLASLSPELVDSLMEIKTGEQDLIKIDTDKEWLQLAVNATRFNLQNENYILVSLQNIGAELEEKELEAVQHMTRVLAHEIMNSITPIASLAGSAKHHLEIQGETLDPEDLQESYQDLRDALDTIEKRSHGLLNFVTSYRQIARIPRPDFQLVNVEALFNRVVQLFESQAQAQKVQLEIKVEPETLSVLADPDLIEQVLINLLKNALEAIADQQGGKVVLEGLLNRKSKVLLKITDNGPGISIEMQEQIFVPFYSTKSAGSGIGLSLSRQILRRHGGSLRVQTQPGGPTTFMLRF
ncbi:MAG: PAS domain-containing sensor histidine kinase [Rhodothermales bacterium]